MTQKTIQDFTQQEYKYGFRTEIEADTLPKGLTEETVRAISALKNEPEFMLAFRLKAFRHWQGMKEPVWAHIHHPPIDFQNAIYYAAPKKKKVLNSLDEVDPELLATFAKLGIPLDEQKMLSGVAVDAVSSTASLLAENSGGRSSTSSTKAPCSPSTKKAAPRGRNR